MLPNWIFPEAVGGNSEFAAEFPTLTPGAGTAQTTIAAFTKALEIQSSGTRFFRSVAQWASDWQRYSIAAVVAGHLTLEQTMVHSNAILWMAEMEVARGRPVQLGFLYDDRIRKKWHSKVKAGVAIDFGQAMANLDEEAKGECRERMNSVLQLTGFKQSVTYPGENDVLSIQPVNTGDRSRNTGTVSSTESVTQVAASSVVAAERDASVRMSELEQQLKDVKKASGKGKGKNESAKRIEKIVARAVKWYLGHK